MICKIEENVNLVIGEKFYIEIIKVFIYGNEDFLIEVWIEMFGIKCDEFD